MVVAPQSFIIYTGESRPCTETYVCAKTAAGVQLTGTLVGTATVTLLDANGNPVTGYNAVNVDAQDTGTAASLSMRKQIDCSTGQIPIGAYTLLFKPVVSLSDLSTDDPEIPVVVNVLSLTV